MTARTKLEVVICVGFVLAIFGLFASPGRTAPTPPVPAKPEARFQMAMASSENVTYVVVFDSTTGQCWSQRPDTNYGWSDMGVPVPAKK